MSLGVRTGRSTLNVETLLSRLYWLPGPVLAFLTGIRGIAAVPLWVDELYTVQSLDRIFSERIDSLVFIPYNTIVWVLSGGGSCLTETCLRFPSLLAVVGGSLLTAMTARKVLTPAAGLSAGLIYAITPSLLRSAHDARPYAFVTILTALSILLLVEACNRNHLLAWSFYAIATFFAVLVMPTTVFILVGQAIILVFGLHASRLMVRRWLTSLFFVFIMLVGPALWLSWFGEIDPANRTDPFQPGFEDPLQLFVLPINGGFFGLISVGFFAAVLASLGLLHRSSTPWITAGIASVGSLWIASFFTSTVWVGRYAIPLVGFFVVGAAIGIAQLSRWKALTAFGLLFIAALPAYQANVVPWARGMDWRTAMAAIDSGWQVGDSIVFDESMQPAAEWAIDYYGARTDYRLSISHVADKRAWVVDQKVVCDASTSIALGPNSVLRLCD